MKTTHLHTGSLLAAFFLFLLTSLATQAQKTDDVLAQLHAFRVSNYVSLDAYYRFLGDGTTDTLNEIVAGINTANSSMKLLTSNSGGVLTDEQAQTLEDEFNQFKNLMRDNIEDVRETGFPDLRLVSDMANQAVTLNKTATEFYQVAQEDSQVKINPRVAAARMGAVQIAQMRAKYSVRTNTSISQTFQGSSMDVPLDEQAKAFEQFLGTVNNDEAEGEVKKLLSDITSKWEFIRGSYINYNKNNVGFVIDRYSKQIQEGLTTVIALLQKNA